MQRDGLRVLLVEDSPDDAELVLNELRAAGYDVSHERVDTPEAMAGALERGGWDAVVSDHNLPRFSAPAALALVQARGLDVPFVIVSGAIGEDVAVAAMRAGAHDYILKDNLTRLVPALRRELREARERERRRELEDALRHRQQLEAMGRIAAAVAHDFSNYLTAIRGFGELMAETAEPEARHQHLERMIQVAANAQTLIGQLLTFGRGQPTSPRPVDLNSALRDAEPMLRRLAGATSRVVLELCPDAPAVLIDPSQLQQVLLNLIANARDAMPAGGTVVLTTEAAVAENGDRYVVLSVSDTGMGMEEEVRTRLFEPYFTTKPAGKGTGLGLATVYGIVTRGGGRIEVESQPGRGTTFRISLPIANGATAPAAT